MENMIIVHAKIGSKRSKVFMSPYLTYLSFTLSSVPVSKYEQI
jgi:hypothetical protein